MTSTLSWTVRLIVLPCLVGCANGSQASGSRPTSSGQGGRNSSGGDSPGTTSGSIEAGGVSITPMPDSVSSSVAAHAARNRDLVALISKKGGDLTARRVIDLHFWSPDKTSAGRLTHALREFGVDQIKSNQSKSDPSLWNVEGQILASVNEVVADEFVHRLVSLAVANRSVFDGWGTSL